MLLSGKYPLPGGVPLPMIGQGTLVIEHWSEVIL